MTPRELHDHIKRLSPRGPVACSLERIISGGGMTVVWYSTQKEHLLGWLAEYDGPGCYGRTNWRRSAEFVYNHFQCAPGLLWLAEAAGAPRFVLVKARAAASHAGDHSASQCAAVRGVMPWVFVEALLKARGS
jgi:hypothetical protein